MELIKLSKQNNKTLFLIFAFFIFSIIGTISAWYITDEVVKRESNRMFYNRVNVIESWVEERSNIYAIILYSIQGLFEGSNSVDRTNWSNFIKKTELMERYPGLSSVLFVEKVEHENKDEFIKRIREESDKYPYLSEFEIKPDTKKDEYYVINFIEQSRGKGSTFGLDFGREEKRLKALHEARDTGEITTIGKIILQTTNKPGFALVAPVYKKGSSLNSEEERRNALLGFAVMIFRENEFFEAAFGGNDPAPYLDIKIYNGKEKNSDELIYNHPSKSLIPENMKLSAERTISVKKGPWTLVVEGNKSTQLLNAQQYLPKIVLITGFGFSTLFFILLLINFKKFSNNVKESQQKT